MKRIIWTIAATLPLLGGPVLADDKGEDHDHDTVKMEDLPAPVQETLRKESAGGKMVELEQEKDREGQVIYEPEIVKQGHKREVEIDATGKVVERGKPHHTRE
jgi:uncharacterized membrane protein YkoI